MRKYEYVPVGGRGGFHKMRIDEWMGIEEVKRRTGLLLKGSREPSSS